MAEVNIQTVTLSGYKASVQGAQYLRLGTWDSYGIEQLQIVPGPEWTGLVIKAVFVTAAGTTPVVVPDSGLIDVPPEATAQALGVESPGMIVFSGVTAGVQRITCNLLYLVSDHAPIDGTAPDPTPDQWAQFVAMVQQYAQQASQSATEAAGSATAAASSATASAASAKQAKDAAASVSGAVEAVESARDGALKEINSAKDTAVQALQAEANTGVSSVEAAATKAASGITSSGAAALEAIGQTEQAAIGQVQQAGQAQLDKIAAANALVPTPTQADAGKAIIVKPDGSGYALGEVQTDAYTKSESDARYAPIAAAIRPTVSGNPATLDHSVAWALQGLAVYGKSTQVTTTGAQLIDLAAWKAADPYFATFYALDDGGLTILKNDDRSNTDVPVFLTMPAGTYTLSIDDNGVVIQVNDSSTGELGFASKGRPMKITFETEITVGFKCYLASGNMFPVGPVYPMFVSGSTAKPWEPYTGGAPSPSPAYPQPINTAGAGGSITVAVSDGADQSQQLIIPTPNGLPGIPVDSGGTYTDASGQQWVADVVDQSGTTKNVVVVVLDGTESVSVGTIPNAKYPYFEITGPKIVNAYKPVETPWMWNKAGISNYFSAGNPYSEPGNVVAVLNQNDTNKIRIGFSDLETFHTAQEVKNWLAGKYQSGNPVIVMYPAEVSTVTPLTDEELAAYAALRSYNGTTIVSTEAPVAGLSARYVADGAAYIDSKIQSALAPVNRAILEVNANV